MGCSWLQRTTILAAILLLAGCSGSSTMGDVQGEVMLDGAPLAQGAIQFIPLDGKSPTAGARIENGKFSSRAPIAKHRVEIISREVRGTKGKPSRVSDDELVAVDLVPARYNSKSELTWDVQPGLNERQFDLKSR